MDEACTEKPPKENPKQFLQRMKGKSVVVSLKWGQSYEGVLVTSDNYFNILLDKCIEKDGEASMEVGEVSIRCNNIKSISEG
ncbi:Sm protein F [Encephalitozoon hellem]|nr:Sm protein F [Encephalitozoon hellem]